MSDSRALSPYPQQAGLVGSLRGFRLALEPEMLPTLFPAPDHHFITQRLNPKIVHRVQNKSIMHLYLVPLESANNIMNHAKNSTEGQRIFHPIGAYTGRQTRCGHGGR